MSFGSAPTLTAGGTRLGKGFQRTSAILLGIHVIGAGLLFLYNVVVARMIGREAYGLFVYAENIAELLLPVALLGLPQVLVRFVSIYRADGQWARLRGLRRIARCAGLAASIVIGALAYVGYGWLWPSPVPTGSWLLPIGLALLPVLTLLHLDQSILQGLRAPIAGMLPNQIVRPLLALGGTVTLWWLARLDASTALLVLLASMVATEALTAVVTRRRIVAAGGAVRGGLDVEPIRQWLAMSWVLLAVSIARRLVHRVNIIVIGGLASAGEVGLYAIGFQATRFIGFAVASVGTVTGPYVAAMFRDRELGKLQAMFDDAVRWIALIAVPIAIGFLIFGERLLALFGEAYQGGYPTFAALVIAQLVGAITGPTASMLTMAGDQKWLLASLIAGGVVNVTVSVWTVPAHGAFGGAVGTLGGLVVANVAMLAVLRWKYGLRFRLTRATAVREG